jgi:hypothetical protein
MHRIDPIRLDLARKFKAAPLGPHSAELRKLLKIMRWDPVNGRVVAVRPDRDGRWWLSDTIAYRKRPVSLSITHKFDPNRRAKSDIC